MASERDFEFLDKYLTNRLEGSEKEAFEQRLRQDPDLQSEYNIQLQIADGLRAARKAELKQMLNAVPVPPAGGSITNTAIIVSLALITGLTLFFLFWQPDQPADPAQETVQTTPVPESSVEPTNEEETSFMNEPSAEEPAVNTQAQQKPREKASSSRTAVKPPPAKPDVFDPSAETETVNQDEDPAAISLPADLPVEMSQMEVETDNSSRKYTFHYQFRDDKLILYGSFEKNLYTILEFFSDEKRTIFLHYKSNYYLLNTASEKVNALVPVNDPVLLKKLREQRNGVQ
jgi:hypothetical protein